MLWEKRGGDERGKGEEGGGDVVEGYGGREVRGSQGGGGGHIGKR